MSIRFTDLDRKNKIIKIHAAFLDRPMYLSLAEKGCRECGGPAEQQPAFVFRDERGPVKITPPPDVCAACCADLRAELVKPPAS